jgi:hypothetical protein
MWTMVPHQKMWRRYYIMYLLFSCTTLASIAPHKLWYNLTHYYYIVLLPAPSLLNGSMQWLQLLVVVVVVE